MLHLSRVKNSRVKTSAAARAALPVPTSVCSVFVCPNNGMAASVRDCYRAHKC